MGIRIMVAGVLSLGVAVVVIRRVISCLDQMVKPQGPEGR
jgi:hypothetical protein